MSLVVSFSTRPLRIGQDLSELIGKTRRVRLVAAAARARGAQAARSDSATTRSACAAIVSAGFIAADEGKKLASTTHRFARS